MYLWFSYHISSSLTPDNDYNSTVQTVILAPGHTEACVNISITQDTEDESDEQFCVNVTTDNAAIKFQPSNCQIIVTIKDYRSKC